VNDERVGGEKKGSRSKLSGRRALRRGWASLRRVSARVRGGLAEGGEKNGWRSEPLPGQGVSRLSQARKRAKKALALACLIAICKYQECFSALRPTRTNCDYLAEIKRSLSRIHRSNGAIDTSSSRLASSPHRHRYVYMYNGRFSGN